MILADYNFTDPGIYAEDSSFDLAEYPDFDGDGIGRLMQSKRSNSTLPTDVEMLNKSQELYIHPVHLIPNLLGNYREILM